MKKLILVLGFAACIGGLGAQLSPVLLTNPITGDTLNNGSVSINGSAEVYFGVDAPINQKVRMTNTGVDSVFMLVRRQLLTPSTGTDHQFCWGPICYGPMVELAIDTIILAPGAQDNTFDAYFFPNGNGGMHQVRYTFFDANNVADSSAVEMSFNTPLSVTGAISAIPQVGAAYPNPARDQTAITYQVGENDKVSLEVYNIAGALVAQEQLASGSATFTLSTANLKSGVYFYTFRINGKAVQTKRLIIAR